MTNENDMLQISLTMFAAHVDRDDPVESTKNIPVECRGIVGKLTLQEYDELIASLVLAAERTDAKKGFNADLTQI